MRSVESFLSLSCVSSFEDTPLSWGWWEGREKGRVSVHEVTPVEVCNDWPEELFKVLEPEV